MRLFITAKPGAKIEKIEQLDAEHFIVAVKEPPIQGRANQAILKALARFLDVAPSRLRIVAGYANRQKVIEAI